MSILARRIAEQRKKKKLSQTKFAEKFGVGRSTIAMWETGDREPDAETIQKLADFFDVTTDYLLGRTDDPNPVNKDEADIKKILEQKEKAHFDGHPLTEEERRFISDMIRLAIRRQRNKDEEAATKENA